jgi:hypothetical protein
MKLSNKIIGSLVVVAALSGCGELKALKKTGEVPDKMDRTNESLDKTSKQMDRTNETLDQTRGAIHRQELIIPLTEMLKPENWTVMSPVPFKLMPFGKAFAEAAHADEIINLFYLYMKDIKEVGVDFDTDWMGDEVQRARVTAEGMFREKVAKLTIMQIIAGFAPEETVAQIIAHEIDGDTADQSQRFKDVAQTFMVMRARFINDVLIANSIMSGNLTNVGMLESAIEQVQKLELINLHPAVATFKQVLTGSIKYWDFTAGEAKTYEFDFSDSIPDGQSAPKAWWEKIKFQLSNVVIDSMSTSVGENGAVARKARAVKTVNERIEFWNSHQD